MAFPKTIDELTAHGYRFTNEATCRGRQCGQRIEWWLTPNGKKLPLDVDESGNVTAHWGTCPSAKEFRGGG